MSEKDLLPYLNVTLSGPAEAPGLHRGVLVPPGVLPGGRGHDGPQVPDHPGARGPGHHLPVPVLSLRPPQDGGHPRQQAGQQTTGKLYKCIRHRP